jgi:hypothetical protein
MENYIEKYLNRIHSDYTFLKRHNSGSVNEYNKPFYELENNYHYYKLKKIYEENNNMDIVENRITGLFDNNEKIYCYGVYHFDRSEIRIYKKITHYL